MKVYTVYFFATSFDYALTATINSSPTKIRLNCHGSLGSGNFRKKIIQGVNVLVGQRRYILKDSEIFCRKTKFNLQILF